MTHVQISHIYCASLGKFLNFSLLSFVLVTAVVTKVTEPS